MKIKLPYMGKVAGLALIQSTVSAIGLLLTCILWDKWQSCHKKDGDDYIMYRMGLWEKCIDKFLLRESKCNKLTHETAEMKCVIMLMLLSISLQSLSVIMGLVIRRYERQHTAIFVPILFNFASAMCGTAGLIIYAFIYDKTHCQLSASYFIGTFGIIEVYISCFLYILVANGK